MSTPLRQRMFLDSTGNGLFLRPDLGSAGRRAQGRSRMAEGHREAARSVLDRSEHGGRMNPGRGHNRLTF